MEELNDMSVHVESNEESDVMTVDKIDDGDDDDDDENGIDATTTETEQIDRRDEVGEVRKMSSKDTNRLRLWRIVVTGVLLLTALAVTFTTYTLLKKQENENFKTAVSSCDVISWSFIGHLSVHVKFAHVLVWLVNRLFPLSYTVCTVCSYRWRCRSGPTTTYAGRFRRVCQSDFIHGSGDKCNMANISNSIF
jgi:hypothetical protein